jgi:cell division protein FtsQ
MTRSKGDGARRAAGRRAGTAGRMALAMGALALAAAGGGWWLVRGGWPAEAGQRLAATALEASARLGLKVEEVIVIGRRETSRKDLLEALRLERGSPILALDPRAARARAERLPWVRAASVERLLPDTVVVTLTERTPLAIWQHKGQMALIDGDGAVIERDGIERFGELPLVVGEDAPAHAAELLKTLALQPALMAQVKAAVRVGGRRWNLRLANGADVRLPEEDAGQAWARLAEYARTHRVLEEGVELVDLRIPDRLVVRKAPRPDAAPAKPGKDA